VAQRQRPGSAQVVTGLAAAPAGSGGAEIVYTLAQDSGVDITITNIAGRPVKRLLVGAEQASGEQRTVWNGLSDQGVRVPRGRYLIRVTARAADSTSSSRVTALNLAR
jgi:flagellar hook assembly protein FlgD